MILAVPVAPPATVARLGDVADQVICVESPEPFFAIGQWYHDFSQTSDAEVVSLLGRAAGPREAGPAISADVQVTAGALALPGLLTVPAGAGGIVLFAHGSGSGRGSGRNLFVASALHRAGLATLLFDLLTPAEEAGRSSVFDVGLLAGRLTAATGWVRRQPELDGISAGYFGASTGAAAALRAAAEPGSRIAAVVSRGGRPDLAGPALGQVRAPTLLIVGGLDDQVLALNVAARAKLRSASELSVVQGATHLFPEPGALERVAALARDWFGRYLHAGQAAGH